jgi:hypothetical protein
MKEQKEYRSTFFRFDSTLRLTTPNSHSSTWSDLYQGLRQGLSCSALLSLEGTSTGEKKEKTQLLDHMGQFL